MAYPFSDGDILYGADLNKITYNKYIGGLDNTGSITSNTTISGILYYENLYVASGITLTLTRLPPILFVNGSFINNGNVLAYGSGTVAGGAGGLAGSGFSGTSGTDSISSEAGAGYGGTGGSALTRVPVGSGAPGGFFLTGSLEYRNPLCQNTYRYNACGGGGGGGAAYPWGIAGAGGAGGGGAPTLYIYARHLVNSGNIYTVGKSGANGGNASSTNGSPAGGGGGGGGGAGGYVIIHSDTFADVGNIYSSGGAYGLGGTGASGGQDGHNGTAGSNGTVWVNVAGSWIQ
jgi:hypothetical protein